MSTCHSLSAVKEQTKTAGSELLSKKLDSLVPEKRGGQKELARRIGRTQDAISRWANGWREPSSKDMALLEDVLFIPIRAWTEGPERLEHWEAVSLELEAQSAAREASAEPPTTFPADDQRAVGGV